MQFRQAIRFEISILIIFHLLMALAGIWIFSRMAPVVDKINAQSLQSLQECDRMLSILAELPDKSAAQRFELALSAIPRDIAGNEESLAFQQIWSNYEAALQGDTEARKVTLEAINTLAKANRLAIQNTAQEARQEIAAGSWSAVFMAIIYLITLLIIMRRIIRTIIHPLEEIDAVIDAHKKGDRLRRCTGAYLPPNWEKIYSWVNELIDHEKES